MRAVASPGWDDAALVRHLRRPLPVARTSDIAPRRLLASILLLLVGATPLADQRAALKAATAAARAAEARAAALTRAAETERDEAARAARQEAALGAQIAATEADLIAGRQRVAITDRLLAAQRARLAARQVPVERLVAGLALLARRPAALALAQPGSTREIVHVRAVLGSIAPIVAARTAVVRADLARTAKLRADAALAARALASTRRELGTRQLALAQLQADHRLRSRDLDRGALFESDRAIALGEQARDIADRMVARSADAATLDELASLPGPLPRPARAGAAGGGEAFAVAPYRLPVAGRLVEGLGELSGAGVRARGLTIAAPAGAAVVAPAAGRVLFARRFRDYGFVVILDHGNGWSSALTGLGSATARTGTAVAAGNPVGRVGADGRTTVELRRRGTAIDIPPLLG